MGKRVIVDENAGQNSALWREFQRVLGGQPWEFVFLQETHPGIPDVEILDKLFRPGAVLLTADLVLHARAIHQGIRSYTLNQQGQLTRQRQPGLKISKSLPRSVHTELQRDYHHQPDHDINRRLKLEMTEKQLKRYRTARRRIRSYFGSSRAITQVAVTIGSKTTRRGLLCGFAFQLAGNSGRGGLRATEGYCLTADSETSAAYPVIHALRELYLLQLEQIHTQLFVIPPGSLDLSRHLLSSKTVQTVEPLSSCLGSLLHQAFDLGLDPCVKGRFFDGMQRKLDRLDRTGSNELKSVDFTQLAESVMPVATAISSSLHRTATSDEGHGEDCQLTGTLRL